ncbi:16S rRNA (guanine(527)-N(7))-methyltransferase RsmG [Variovorax dokdonensis]|uniref:Ribosomal RNA small subunit methyltransferase G n=1 Tax=Variovorax dokdonensis TaxID=344883 RepID=A0ABT7NFL5_9BURK|nr:16S rRNA (guanine(527)-N(7))-methyltransferase RsmG [Variovorax dokdonensis]MDM0046739.1 16S rRNA (guanine(527)-N(7))-methyltransferase RsmG [Variovorax dokdonensis]
MSGDRDALLRQGAEAMGLSLSDAQCASLQAYADLILKWNKVYNLTALRSPEQVLSHHLLDSLSVVGPLQRQCPGAARLLDVGSGAGLPGAVIAIMRPDLSVTCVDAVAKKAAFIRQVSAELNLPHLNGRHARVETMGGRFDVVCSRAFASLTDFVRGSAELIAPGGCWMAMKGKLPTDEIADLPSDVEVFHVEQLTVPGLDAERCIVWIRPISG